jgi:trehalose 6-phosphate synthase/phosphatase
MPARLIVVSNRLPVTVGVSDDDHAIVRRSIGGLATGLREPHNRSDGIWIGWPGSLEELAPSAREDVLRRLDAQRLVPLVLSPHEEKIFYEHISNEVLWPICHDRLDQLPLQVEGWDVYEAVNQRFADAVAEQYREGDMIWVHDYQLMRVPTLVRRLIPDARIGFFLHIPFPNPEIFFALAQRRWLVEGMLGADVIGFHTRRYRGHFTAALRRLLGIEMEADATIGYAGRRVQLGVMPMGVDASGIAERASGYRINASALELKGWPTRLLLGIDRLDYSKGIPRRLLAYEQLLTRYPEWRERIRLVQVAVPSRGGVPAYRRLRRDVDAQVGRINGEFSTPTWTPVHYLHRSIPESQLLGLYRAADVMLVTPLRDGMNLVAKEFAASRIDEDGVLILSEFAGAADELQTALQVNPYDIDGVADAMHQALTMSGVERRTRMRSLRAQVLTRDVHRWAADFLRALAEV